MQFQQELGGAPEVERHILALSASIKQNILDRAPSAMVSPHTDPALSSGLSVFFPFNWERPQTLFTDKKSWLDAEQRITILEKTADIMQSRFDELAIEAAREGGKPLPDSKVEVARAIDGI